MAPQPRRCRRVYLRDDQRLRMERPRDNRPALALPGIWRVPPPGTLLFRDRRHRQPHQETISGDQALHVGQQRLLWQKRNHFILVTIPAKPPAGASGRLSDEFEVTSSLDSNIA